MSDESQLIKCPSCGHENATYVDKCIICDFPLARYMNQPQTRPMNSSRGILEEPRAQTNKKLGPLPDSDMLADKQKRVNNAPQLLQCADCGEKCRVGTVLCNNCGARMDNLMPLDQLDVAVDDTEDAMPLDTRAYKTDTQPVYESVDHIKNRPTETPAVFAPDPLMEAEKNIPSGCVKFTSWMILKMEVIGFDTPIVIRPIEDKPLLIGRRHESLPVQPQIDLTAYLTDRHGISRRHALLRLRGTRLEIQDLKSTNGTYINGVRFAPKECHQLRHQDIVQIGQIQIRVNFIKQVHSATIGHTEELR